MAGHQVLVVFRCCADEITYLSLEMRWSCKRGDYWFDKLEESATRADLSRLTHKHLVRSTEAYQDCYSIRLFQCGHTDQI